MRVLTIAALVSLALAGFASAQETDAELMAPIQKFIASFNKGDMAGAAATHAAGADLAIIDEVAPYVWRGPKACRRGRPISTAIPRSRASPSRRSH